jgi:AcrR family transcriptional regulator
VGTVYRHFPQKDALMGELVASKFRTFADNAAIALTVADPWEAFAGLLRQNAEACARDAGIQQALGREPDAWAVVAPELERLRALVSELIGRGQAAGVLRADLAVDDIPLLMCGLSATQAVPGYDWRRHLEMLLDAMRPPGHEL